MTEGGSDIIDASAAMERRASEREAALAILRAALSLYPRAIRFDVKAARILRERPLTELPRLKRIKLAFMVSVLHEPPLVHALLGRYAASLSVAIIEMAVADG